MSCSLPLLSGQIQVKSTKKEKKKKAIFSSCQQQWRSCVCTSPHSVQQPGRTHLSSLHKTHTHTDCSMATAEAATDIQRGEGALRPCALLRTYTFPCPRKRKLTKLHSLAYKRTPLQHPPSTPHCITGSCSDMATVESRSKNAVRHLLQGWQQVACSSSGNGCATPCARW